MDTGDYLTSSTLYLVTNCTNEGISGPGNITGNPIPSSNPTGQQLTQNYAFNSSDSQQVEFTYDLSQAQSSRETIDYRRHDAFDRGYTPRPDNLHHPLSAGHVVCDRELPAPRR